MVPSRPPRSPQTGDLVEVSGRIVSGDGAGLPGVTVTDGVAVARAGADGRYTLSVDMARRMTPIVSITVPAGWQPPIDAHNAPQFFRRVDPAQPSGVDFVLHRDSASEREAYRFVALTDVHVQAGTTSTAETFGRQLAAIDGMTRELDGPEGPPGFLAIAGDLTNDASHAEFRDYLAAITHASIPVWSAVGNHDLAGREKGGPYPRPFPAVAYRDLVEVYRKTVGPEWYSFQYGPHHFVVLENYRGLGEPDQLAWLERDLALHGRGRRVVVVSHVPWNVPQTPGPHETAPYLDVFSRYDVQLLLAGHTHANDVAGGVLPGALQVVTTSPASPLDGTPRGFRVLGMGAERVRGPYYELDPEQRTTVVFPVGSVPWHPELPLRVTRYSAPGTQSEGEYRLDEQPWRPMRPTGRRTWTASIDVGLANGAGHDLRVRVRQRAEQPWAEHRVGFDVTAGERPVPRQGTPWPMHRADARRSGVTADVVVPPLTLAWARDTGGTVLSSSPALVGGAVFIGTRDEDGEAGNGVAAFDLATGEPRWGCGARSPVEASVAVAEGMVLAPSVRGPLQALDARTGTVRWEWTPDRNRSWMYFSPAVDDGAVYQAFSTADGVRVAMLDVRSGEIVGETERPAGRNWISRGSPAIAAGRLYFTTAYGNLVAADARSGALLWQVAHGVKLAVRSAPVVADGVVLLALDGDRLVAVDAEWGELRWTHESTAAPLLAAVGTASGPAVADGVAYVGFGDGSVTAVRLGDGEPIWRHQTDGPVLSAPAVSGDVLYVGSHDGRLRALSRASGECLWSHDVGTWIASSPAVTGNAVVVGAWDGAVYTFVAE